jgi:large subunit ribosomal protein L25
MNLTAQKRTITGKKVKTLRNQGIIPAELYGHGIENKHLQVNEKEFKKIYAEAGEHTVIQLKLEGEKENVPVLITHAPNHPTKDHTLTIDFHQIRMDESIQTHVPIEFIGESPGEKAGLVLVKVTDELEIEALPTKIPHEIAVDIAGLENAGDAIHLSDITLPEGVSAIAAPETVIASLSEQQEEIVEEAPPETEESKKSEEKPTEPAEAGEGVPSETEGSSKDSKKEKKAKKISSTTLPRLAG